MSAAERDYWSLSLESKVVLRNFLALLSHPCLDLSPRERERYEADAQALAALLPPRRGEETTDATKCPF